MDATRQIQNDIHETSLAINMSSFGVHIIFLLHFYM